MKQPIPNATLFSLGTAPGPYAQQDVIQIVAKPVRAGEPLSPGERVFFMDGDVIAYSALGKLVRAAGVVDPLLSEGILPGDMFWCVLFPPPTSERERKASLWLARFCEENSLDYSGLWEMADDIKSGKHEGLVGDMGRWYVITDWCVNVGDDYNLEDVNLMNDDGNDIDLPDEFWKYVQIVTGEVIPANIRVKFA